MASAISEKSSSEAAVAAATAKVTLTDKVQLDSILNLNNIPKWRSILKYIHDTWNSN